MLMMVLKSLLIFHDAVRPLVNDRIISDCIQALEKYNAVDVAIKLLIL